VAKNSGVKQALAQKFEEEIRFFKGWMDKPKAVGSIFPTSSVTARRMASVVEVGSGLPVLELGPGTGVITRAILERGIEPRSLYSVEHSKNFVRSLRREFPGINLIQGDAFDLDAALGENAGLIFDCVISAVPLLNFSSERRIVFVNDVLSRIPPGRPVIQITYGPMSPVPVGLGDYVVEHFDFVIRNLPPAQLWIYRRGSRG